MSEARSGTRVPVSASWETLRRRAEYRGGRKARRAERRIRRMLSAASALFRDVNRGTRNALPDAAPRLPLEDLRALAETILRPPPTLLRFVVGERAFEHLRPHLRACPDRTLRHPVLDVPVHVSRYNLPESVCAEYADGVLRVLDGRGIFPAHE